MKPNQYILLSGIFAAAFMAASPSARAQVQTTGTPGSPSATTTIDGRYIPNPPPPFAGKVNLSAANSKPGWPPNVAPPKGAPNILPIMTDDQGYGVTGTFGGVIPTPTMDRLAKAGCATRSSIRRRSARRHGRRSLPAATTTRSAPA